MEGHVHLDLPGNVNGSGVPIATYKIVQWQPVPQVAANSYHSATGTTSYTVVCNESGAPVVHLDYQHIFKLTTSEFATFIGLVGKELLFIDVIHDDDNNPEDLVQRVFFQAVNSVKTIYNANLAYIYLTAVLIGLDAQ